MEMQKRFFETNPNCRKAKVPLSEFDLYSSTTIQPNVDVSDIVRRFNANHNDFDDEDYDYEDGKIVRINVGHWGDRIRH